MYFVEDEKIAENLQRKLNAPGTNSPGKERHGDINLTDSILEYRDPTPNIHELFVLFDKRYFWGKLGMVEVKWSKRMTLCAGLCYYQGKRGLCSIKLSAPLLTLRPRKDLVQTLLHEMIHAYLFVTDNFRDRDDHGPEFQKHMHRINEEAGTNISVYHTFYDEVAYYQNHIWRCNGPCQNRRPFFGFVKRSMNRAPGPNDNWWQEHHNNCGGVFIKVSEPSKPCKKKGLHEKEKNQKSIQGIKDIRDFFQTESPKIISPTKYSENLSKTSNIYTIKDLNNSTNSNSNSPNVKGSIKTNVISPKTDSDQSDEVYRKIERDAYISMRATVRNAWVNKYQSPNNLGKRSSDLNSLSPINLTIKMKRTQVNCPVCNKPFSETMINEHIDECLAEEKSKEILNETMPLEEKGQSDLDSSCEKNFNLKLVQCPVCGETLERHDVDEHLEVCLDFTFKDANTSKDDETDCDKVPCPCCLKWVVEKSINNHIDECLTFIALKSSVKRD